VESDSDQDEVSLNKYNSAVVDEPGKLGWRGMRGGILSLRMGLGKTITATSLCLMEAKDPVNKLPNLVVVPKTLILEWKFHFEQFYGERVKVLYYHRDYLSDRQMQSLELWELQQYDFIVTSYDFIRGVSNRYELWKFVVEWTEMGKRRKVNIRSRPNWEDVRWGQFSGPMLLFMVPWRRIICDESQHFANPTTSLFEAMCALYADHKWCLTGTPMKNQMKDIWAQLRWCGLDFSFKYNRPPHGIGRGKIPTPWTEAMVKKYKNYIATYGLGYHIDIQRFDIDRHNRWKPWMYRGFDVDDRILQYEYKDTNIRLPSLNEVRVPVNLTNEEWEIYQEVFDQTVKTYQGYMSGGNKRLSRTSSTGITYANVLAKFTRLRQICIAPHLITLESKREAVAGKLQIDQELKKKLNEMTDGRENKLRNPKSNYGIFSTKINKTLHIIDSVLNDNQNHTSTSTSTSTSSSISGPNERLNKVLVFTNFLGAIDLLKLALRERMGISKVLVLDGASKDRGAIVKKFQEDDSFRILILNYAVGAQGLNLTAGNHVILMNQWWCPMVHKQAVARAWRIGQNRSVKVYKLIAEKTIEETMIEKYNNAKIQQIDDLYDGHEVKLDKYVMGPILGINGSSCINIGGY
jgi:SNF2 family DNA or RNA helicase